MSNSLNLQTGSPVSCRVGGEWREFPLKFSWQGGIWFDLFQRHADFIKQEIARRRAEGRHIVYLSCPIRARNGGFTATNVEVAIHAARNIEKLFGSRFWVLNPALYQMESRAGIGLIQRHARLLSLEKRHAAAIDLEALHQTHPLIGGDYLRMWTRVLVEDGSDNLGDNVDAFYFMGPSDAWSFFTRDGCNILDGIEDYLARRITLDPEYQVFFSDKTHGNARRNEFIEYYVLKVGAAFSCGSRDEFAIWRTLNTLRVKQRGLGFPIPAFSAGGQLNLLEDGAVLKGYAV